MQILSLSALSALVLTTAGVVDAIPAVHDSRAASGHHRAIARQSVPRAGSVVPPTLRSKKRDANKVIQKKCRLRPTSSTVIASPTSSTPSVTGTVIGSNSTTSTTVEASTSSAPETTSAPEQVFSNQWQLQKVHNGTSFFDGWDFWSLADPTHGTVDFQNVDAAWQQGLIGFEGNAAIMRVNTDNNVGNRKSIRIHDQYKFNINSIVIMDADHIPTGCGTWPAWWSNGDNWPIGGEIDIVEGVHDQGHNQATLHTKNGCTAVPDNASGQQLSPNCGVQGTDNSGCGYADYSSGNSFGAGFNEAGGGTYVMQWVASGLSVWFFPRGTVPADVVADAPMPWTWSRAPFAKWAASGCSPYDFFTAQTAIFDTTFCGDWAGATWGSSGCAEKTGYGDCSSFVSARGDAFHEAYWKVNYVKYFSQNA
jgi:hypothetical protein